MRKVNALLVVCLVLAIAIVTTPGSSADGGRDSIVAASTARTKTSDTETATVATIESVAITRSVMVYLVELADERGRRRGTGRRIGCDDLLVPVRRSVAATGAPLRAALEELLSIPPEGTYAGRQLNNFCKGSNLQLSSVAIRGGVATIRISGTLSVAGVCDQPRITSQIEATARQFPTVRRVRVFVNNVPLREAIS